MMNHGATEGFSWLAQLSPGPDPPSLQPFWFVIAVPGLPPWPHLCCAQHDAGNLGQTPPRMTTDPCAPQAQDQPGGTGRFPARLVPRSPALLPSTSLGS